MKSTPENKIKQLGIALLDEYKVFHYPAVAGAYSVAGIPDRVGCFHGRFLGIEFKAPGKKPTALQVLRRDQILAAGGAWFLVDGPESLDVVRDWLHKVLDEEAESPEVDLPEPSEAQIAVAEHMDDWFNAMNQPPVKEV